jgi:sensor histidine kinase YesM
MGLRIAREPDISNMTLFIGSQILFFILCFFIWLVFEYILQNAYLRYKWLKVVVSLSTACFLSISFYLLTQFQGYSLDTIGKLPNYWQGFRLIYRGITLWLLMYPLAHYFIQNDKVQKERLEIEQLKQQSLLTELVFLQEQLNPHFLFNSLNVLKSGTQDRWAKNFAIELSNVYRYLLEYNNGEYLVALKPELDFILSYIHILKERFEAGLHVNMNVSENCHEYKIPPLSIQLLIENAVKHNIISLGRPLYIEVFDENDLLVVKNNIQRKRSLPFPGNDHTGIGLQNLKTRYKIISGLDIYIIEENSTFTVKIPLIK